MRLTEAYIPTQKEIPSDAVIASHRLMLRAGLIKPLAAGIYSYLPLGWKIMKNVINVIREEMDEIGGQELLMPMLNPIEIWDETGRNLDFGDEMFRLKDRKNRSLNLAPTHEEVICDLARKFISSYKDLPQIWYQIQTKFRDEPRPRSGVLRTRQFLMKDSYTLDTDEKALDYSYGLHAEAYHNIFKRCGLKYVVVGASSGLMGGSGSQEFMAESTAGEDTLIICKKCGYAANLEIARSVIREVSGTSDAEISKVATPGKYTIAEVADFLNKKPEELLKTLVYIQQPETPVVVLLRGDHELNESKLQSFLGSVIRPAHPNEIKQICGADPGSVGPVNPVQKVKLIADLAIQNQTDMTSGANENDWHFNGIQISRDIAPDHFTDLRTACEGEACINCGTKLHMTNAIELGHIFKLGTKYSKSMGATYLDEKGRDQAIIMGSYGIGIERIVASYIEQNCDEHGVCWNKTLAPYLVHLIVLNNKDERIGKAAGKLYEDLRKEKIPVLLDDRDVSPGFKFKDADLLGMPLQIIIGKKSVENDQFEIKFRIDGKKEFVDMKTAVSRIQQIIEQEI